MTRTSTIAKLWLLSLAFFLPQIIIASGLVCKNGFYANLNGSGAATVQAADFVISTGSCCNGGEIFEISLDFGATYQPSTTLNCDQLGTNSVIVRVTDCFGVESTCWTFALVQDNHNICMNGCGGCCKPEPRYKPVILSLSENGTTTAFAEWFNDGSYSNCNAGAVQVSFSQNTNEITKTFTCDELGTQELELWVTDAAGNQGLGTVFVVIQDAYDECPNFMSCLPVPVVLNGVVTNLGADGTVCVSADVYNAGCQTDPCNVGSAVTLSFSPDPNDTEVCFDCDDYGVQEITLYITDNQGTQNIVTTFIVIQNNYGYCDPSTVNIAAPNNDDVLTASSIDQLINASCSATFFNKSATADPNEIEPPLGQCDEPNTWCDANGAEKTVWFQFVAPQAEKLTITAAGTAPQFTHLAEAEKNGSNPAFVAMNTQLALWEAENASAVKLGVATLIAANDDHPSMPNGGSLLVAECLEAGKTYFLQADGHNGETGGMQINIVTEGAACVSSTQSVQSSGLYFTIQPNPAANAVSINLPDAILPFEKEVLILDVSGKTALSNRLAAGDIAGSLDVSKLPDGIYFIHVKAGNALVRAQKLVVMK